jgi:tetratricopeptide (TPR) repeat protein
LKFEPLVVQAQTTQDREAEALWEEFTTTRLNQKGFQLLNRGQFREALEKFQEALVIFREIGERQGEGVILNNKDYRISHQNNKRGRVTRQSSTKRWKLAKNSPNYDK